MSPEAAAACDTLWVSVTELAALKGVTKQTVSEKVARLEAAGQPPTKSGNGREKLVNCAEYDRALDEGNEWVAEKSWRRECPHCIKNW